MGRLSNCMYADTVCPDCEPLRARHNRIFHASWTVIHGKHVQIKKIRRIEQILLCRNFKNHSRCLGILLRLSIPIPSIPVQEFPFPV